MAGYCTSGCVIFSLAIGIDIIDYVNRIGISSREQ